MAHATKYTKGSCGGLTKHYERAKDGEGRYYRFKNQEIDLERTPLNYNLAPQHESQLEFIKTRLENVYCMKRDDVKVMCSWVVTVPQTVPEEHEREFFERTYKFLEERYGKENVISSYVHKDETTPHMHFAFIPVVYDEKKKREKVSAKEVLTKADLKTFHADLQEEMKRFCEAHENEFECDVLNGATGNGNLSVQGMKAKEIEARNEIEMEFLAKVIERSNAECEKLQELQNMVSEAQNELSEVQDELEATKRHVEYLQAEQSVVKSEIETLESKLETLEKSEQSLIAKFLTSTQIKPLFERFCEQMRKLMEQSRAERQERTSKHGIEYFREVIKREKSGGVPSGRHENPFEHKDKGNTSHEKQ